MTDQDLDQRLRARLVRLAGAVPVADLRAADTGRIVRGPVVWAAGVPGRLAVAAVLVATVVIAAWAGGLERPYGPGASPSHVGGTSTPGPTTTALAINLTDPSARAYPDGCLDYDLDAERCARIASWAIQQAEVLPEHLRQVELLGDPGHPCAAAEACTDPMAAYLVVRARVVRVDGTWTDHSVFCGGGYERLINLLCSVVRPLGGEAPDGNWWSFPPVTTPTEGGFMDTPCDPGPGPVGCATPLPTLEPAAVEAARALTLDALNIPIDHVGLFTVRLGEATLANGILDTATMTVTSSPANPLLSYDGYRLDVTSLEGGPPFDNYYLRGWHPGTEDVEATLTFTVFWFEPGAVISIKDVLVR
jgi:hypothetical protein